MSLETPEVQISKAVIKAREENHITQKQLSELTGLSQADISRIENGTDAITLKTLKRLADGLNCELIIQFVKKQTKQE